MSDRLGDWGAAMSDRVYFERELTGGGWFRFYDAWLRDEEASSVFRSILDETPWRQETVRIAGRAVAQPRLTAWFGDPDAIYTYSGLRLTPCPWSLLLAELRARVQEATKRTFNSVLLNYYRDGADSMGLHADQERELGRDPVIASLSLGATRRFVLRYVGKGPKVSKIEIRLSSGSLLLMGGSTQHYWKHGVPKEPMVTGARVNLTFRRVKGSHTEEGRRDIG